MKRVFMEEHTDYSVAFKKSNKINKFYFKKFKYIFFSQFSRKKSYTIGCQRSKYEKNIKTPVS